MQAPLERNVDKGKGGVKRMEETRNSSVTLWRLIVKETEARYLESKIRDYPPAFIRAGDTQSGASLLDGLHERLETEFILDSAGRGFNDFFVDIGANVGIMSVQVGAAFKTVWCYEPNPEVLPILEANLRQLTTPSTTYSYALGSENRQAVLEVPIRNIGGAFLRSSENLYSESDLAKKEGKITLTEVSRREVLVQVRDSKDAFAELFRSIEETFGRPGRGVIKIDVEGMEEFIVRRLLEALPESLEVAIIFENWSTRLELASMEAGTSRQLEWGSVGFRHPMAHFTNKWRKLLHALTHPFQKVVQGTFYPPQTLIGTIVCWVR